MPCVAIALALLTACATPVLCQSDLHMVPPDGDVRSRSSDEACKVMPALRIAAPALSGLDGWTGDADHWADALGDEHPVVADGSLPKQLCAPAWGRSAARDDATWTTVAVCASVAVWLEVRLERLVHARHLWDCGAGVYSHFGNSHCDVARTSSRRVTDSSCACDRGRAHRSRGGS